MKGIFDCGHGSCDGFLVYQNDIEEYSFDWQGSIERDADDVPILIRYAVYKCDQCERRERRFVTFLDYDERPTP